MSHPDAALRVVRASSMSEQFVKVNDLVSHIYTDRLCLC
jgi:hypothetical protein